MYFELLEDFDYTWCPRERDQLHLYSIHKTSSRDGSEGDAYIQLIEDMPGYFS